MEQQATTVDEQQGRRQAMEQLMDQQRVMVQATISMALTGKLGQRTQHREGTNAERGPSSSSAQEIDQGTWQDKDTQRLNEVMGIHREAREKFTVSKKGESKGSTKRTCDDHCHERNAIVHNRFGKTQSAALELRNKPRTTDVTTDHGKPQGKVRRVFAQVMLETGVRAVMNLKGEHLKELSLEQLHALRDQDDGLRSTLPAELSESARHGRVRQNRPPGRGSVAPHIPPDNILVEVWNGQALADHGLTLQLVTIGNPENNDVKHILLLLTHSILSGSTGMSMDSAELLQVNEHFTEKEFAVIKEKGPPNFQWHDWQYCLMKPDRTIPDFFIMPMRYKGSWRPFMQWVYLLKEVTKHIFDRQSALPQPCIAENTTVRNKVMPCDLSFQICQYIAVSILAKAPFLSPLRDALLLLPQGMIAPPNALTSAAQKNPFVFNHMGRLSLSNNGIEIMEENDGVLSQLYEAYRTENFRQFTK